MADITTHYQDHSLLIRVSDAIHGASAPELFVNLVEILSEAERSEDVRSIVLAGYQGFLPTLELPAALSAADAQAWIEGWHSVLDAVDTGSKPVTAVLEGGVSAMGFALALACERVVASRSLRLLLESGQNGVGSGLSWFLGQRVPQALASQILFGSVAPVQPERLLQAGLVGMLTEHGEALDHSLADAACLNRHAPQTVQLARELLRQAPTQSLHAQLEAERHLLWKLQRQSSGR